ncbi:MAG: polysaccharide pyruvyl transferase family protein, partial [Pseudomonadota bacterium]
MSRAGDPCYAELAEALRAASAGRAGILHIVNIGNWGDGLIHAGQRRFFAQFGVEVRDLVVTRRMIPWRIWRLRLAQGIRQPLYLMSGGGVLTAHYPKRVREMEARAAILRPLFLMPSTVAVPLGARWQKAELWVRDLRESLENAPGARFCHDMALFLDPAPRRPIEDDGLLFREDAENPYDSVPAGNRDVAAEHSHTAQSEAFFDAVGRYRRIWTNRLHVAIAGALLGRETHLFANSYFKNRAVFEASLRDRYPHVTFHEGAP